MVSSSSEMPGRRRPTGGSDSIDSDWKANVIKIMKAKGITQHDLAVHCGVRDNTISMMLGAKSKATKIKAKVHEKLGLVAHESTPAIEKDAKLSLFLRRFRDLSDKQREIILSTMAEMLGSGSEH